jgi:hypothetical protein
MITITPQTTARQIADQYAHPMGENIRAVLADAIEKFASFKVADRPAAGIKYLAYVGYNYSTTNALNTAIKKLIDDLDRTLLDQEQLEVFKKTVLEAIEVLNQAHKRCTRIDAHWRGPYSPGDRPDWTLELSGPSIANLTLLASDEQPGAVIILSTFDMVRKETTS